MKTERHKDSLDEAAKNAASGYGVIVLAAICFIVSLAIVTLIVRVIVGASTGTGA